VYYNKYKETSKENN